MLCCVCIFSSQLQYTKDCFFGKLTMKDKLQFWNAQKFQKPNKSVWFNTMTSALADITALKNLQITKSLFILILQIFSHLSL